jgi:hypothetical protein
MRRSLVALSFVFVLLGGVAAPLPLALAEEALVAWEPARTHAVFAGVLEWRDPNLAGFPKKGRQDRALEKALVANGVPARNIVFLEDKEATKGAVLKALREVAGRAGEGSTLVFYFAGHGAQEGGEIYFTPYDTDTGRMKATALAMAEIAQVLEEQFEGSRILLLADCCYSGGLARVVGRYARSTTQSAACLTSATASNISTGNWTFTESIVAAMAGDGRIDADRDGAITFGETDAYVAREMRFKEAQLTRAALTNRFGRETVIRKVAPDREAPKPASSWRVGDYAEVEWQKDWFRAQIIDQRPGEWKVHYMGYASSDDEWVKIGRLRHPQGLTLKGGDKVEVEWQKKWWPAKVLEVETDFALIHYDNYGSEWDEWVTAKRIRKPGGK